MYIYIYIKMSKHKSKVILCFINRLDDLIYRCFVLNDCNLIYNTTIILL